MKAIKFILILLIIPLFNFAQVEVDYDFNNLEIGDLDGQDNWQTILSTTGPHDIFIDLTAGSVVSPDGSLAAYYNGSGAGYGRTATRKATCTTSAAVPATAATTATTCSCAAATSSAAAGKVAATDAESPDER